MQSKLSKKTQPLPHSLAFEAIGTRWRIDTTTTLHGSTLTRIFATIGAFDKKWSRFRSDSLVTKRSQSPGKISLDSDEYAMLSLYQQLFTLSGGAMTPLIGHTLEDMGYDADYSLKPQSSLRKAITWNDALELNPTSLTLMLPVLLDIGAAGKGLIVDRISSILKQHCDSFVVDAGGDMYVYGHTERVGLEQPDDTSQIIGSVTLRDRALCGSASNRRTWSTHHHIVDARSTSSVDSVVATWTLGASAMQADISATALFFIDTAALQSIINIPYVVMYPNGSVRYAKDKEIELNV